MRWRILPMQLHTVFQIRSTMQQRSGKVFIRANILTVLANTYNDPLDYVVSYQDFFKDTLFESGLGMNNMVITMYADNDTIVNGERYVI